MSGYAFAFSSCFGCGRPFSYNPLTVPSIRVNARGQPDRAGQREPICRTCVERANPIRVQNGLLPIEVRPDAYEPVEESAL